MLKTIKIDTKNKIKIDNNVGWALIYRDQFNHDILPDVMPILLAIVDMLGSMTGSEIKKPTDLLKAIDTEQIEDAFIRLAGLEVTTFINVAWAMAKCADDDIPEPIEWVKTIPKWPMDIIAPALFNALCEGLVSTKNWKRLQMIIADLTAKENQ